MTKVFNRFHSRFGSIYPLFQVIGQSFEPLSDQNISVLKFLTRLVVSFYILFEIVAMIYSLINPYKLFFGTDSMGMLTDAIQFEIPTVLPLVVIILSIHFRKLQRKILVTMDEIDDIFESLTSTDHLNSQNELFQSSFYKNFYLMNITCIAVEIFIISRITKNVIWYRNWLIKFPMFVLQRFNDSFFILHANYLQNRFSFLHDTMSDCFSEKFNKIVFKETITSLSVNRLDKLKDVHNLLMMLTLDINRRFGYHLLLCTTGLFICMTIDGYWIFASLNLAGNHFSVESFMCVLPPVINFCVLFFACDSCESEVNQ